MVRLSTTATAGREYLRRANGYLRKSVIALACLNRVMTLPVADITSYGRPLANSLGLRPASDAVRDILFQDRSMAAWVARDSVVAFDALLGTMHVPRGRAGDRDERGRPAPRPGHRSVPGP